MSKFFTKPLKALLDFFFPPFCQHCCDYASLVNSLFCETCTSLLKPIDPYLRCKHCFAELQEGGQICQLCCKKPKSPAIKAAVFDEEGPAKVLCREMQQGSAALAKTLASYMVYQFTQLKWDMPDIITYPTESFAERILQRGYQSRELAKEAALMLGRPFQALLKTRLQGVLKEEIILRNENSIYDQRILVLGVHPVSKKNLDALTQGFPKKVYALSLL